jgi:hypothetical protein
VTIHLRQDSLLRELAGLPHSISTHTRLHAPCWRAPSGDYSASHPC